FAEEGDDRSRRPPARGWSTKHAGGARAARDAGPPPTDEEAGPEVRLVAGLANECRHVPTSGVVDVILLMTSSSK
ncbi:hypothetical protein THAOC_02329, partial [Thalassiosira oceanica]